jgi:hypothetical protein
MNDNVEVTRIEHDVVGVTDAGEYKIKFTNTDDSYSMEINGKKVFRLLELFLDNDLRNVYIKLFNFLNANI